jgi:hypothetical protein
MEDVAIRFDVVAIMFSADRGLVDLTHVEGAFLESPRGFS